MRTTPLRFYRSRLTFWPPALFFVNGTETCGAMAFTRPCRPRAPPPEGWGKAATTATAAAATTNTTEAFYGRGITF